MSKITKAELAEAVRELREEITKLRAEHHCHNTCCWHTHCNWGHCGCLTFHFSYQNQVTWSHPYTVTYTNSLTS
jgi:hypothetical protein